MMFDIDLGDVGLGVSRAEPKWVTVTTNTTGLSARGLPRPGPHGCSTSPSATASPGCHADRQAHKEQQEQGRRARPSRTERARVRRAARIAARPYVHTQEAPDPLAPVLPPEVEEGNVEYKLRLKDPSTARLEQLITQMKFRLAEGGGEAEYVVGVEDGGYARGLSPPDLHATLDNVSYMAKALGAHADEKQLFAVGGSVGCGKSTIVAVLTHGGGGTPLLDNGVGSSRMAVFRHKHEVVSGHTSSINQSLLAYDSVGRVLNYSGVAALTVAELSGEAARTLQFIDLCGHERFLKTALYGMTSLLPDFHMLCVSATAGVQQASRQHFAAALAVEVPSFVVVTKADAALTGTLTRVLDDVRELIVSAGAAAAGGGLGPVSTRGSSEGALADAERGGEEASGRLSASASSEAEIFVTDDIGGPQERPVGEMTRTAPLVSSAAEAARLAELLCVLQQHPCPAQSSTFFMPVFVVSSTTGEGIELLHAFLMRLRQAPRRKQPPPWAPGVPHGLHEESLTGQGAHDPALWAEGCRASASTSANSGAGNASTCCCDSAPGVVMAPGVHSTEPDMTLELPGASAAAAAVAAVTPELRCQGTHTARSQRECVSTGGADEVLQDVHTAGSVAAASETGESLVHFQVDHIFEVDGVGTVASGTLVSGCVELGDTLLWGPAEDGRAFAPVAIAGIHRAHVPVACLCAGQYATLALDAASGTDGQLPRRTSACTRAGSTEDCTPVVGGALAASALPSAVSQCRNVAESTVDTATLSLNLSSSLGQAAGSPASFGARLGCKAASGAVALLTGTALGRGTDAITVCARDAAGAREAVGSVDEEGLPVEECNVASWPCAESQRGLEAVRRWGAAAPHATAAGPASDTGGSQSVSWRHLGLQPAGKPRKGTVLLDRRCQPRSTHGMRAIAILTSGQWPPRGLLSGRWPPEDVPGGVKGRHEAAHVLCAVASATPPPERSTRAARLPKYVHVIHCGSMRQAAAVVSMQEHRLGVDGYKVGGADMAPSCAASAVLMKGKGGESEEGVEGRNAGGALVEVTFGFLKRREWLVRGMRFMTRDQLGQISAVGIVLGPLETDSDEHGVCSHQSGCKGAP